MSTFNNEEHGKLITGTNDGDSIYNYASEVTINALGGDDTIINDSDSESVSIDAGAGNDSINNSSANVTILAGDGHDYIFHDVYKDVEAGSYIDGGAGADTINNWSGSNISISGGAGNDSIVSDGEHVTIDGGAGNDFIEKYGDNNLIIYSGGNDTIAGLGYGDTLLVNGSSYSTVKSGDNVVVKVGSNKITLLDCDPENSYFKITLNESIPEGLSYNKDKTVLTATTKFTGAAIDLANFASSVKTVNASALKKSIAITGNSLSNSLVGGSGADTLSGKSGNDTLTGGKGNDIFVYGGGNDLITDYTEGDKISLGAAVTDTAFSGSDVVFNIGNGSLTINNAKNKTLTLIDSAGNEIETILGSSSTSTLLTVTDKTKSPVKIASTIKTVNASKRTKAVQITGNKLANLISGGSGKDSLYGGAGNDTILGNAGADKLYGQAGNDYLSGGAGNDSLAGGAGNNTLTGGAGNDVFFYGGGNDVITDYAEGDKIKISSGTAQISTSGNNVIFTVGKGKITVSGAADKTVSYIDASGSQTYSALSSDVSINGKTIKLLEDYMEDSFNVADYGAKLQNIDASEVLLDINITGNKLANSILGSGNNETLIGGKGNDTLTGGSGSDIFVYNNGDGNDVITDYSAEDIIHFTSGTAKVAKSGKNVVFTLGKGKLTVTGGASKVITYIDAKGEHTYPEVVNINGAGTKITLLENYMKDTFDVADYGEGIKTIDASAVTHDIEITGNKLANSILGSGNNETLIGGKGNDTLTGGDGSDVFVYSSGDGNDLITDYNEEDKIRFESGKISVKKSGKHVVFTVGTGKITLKDAAAKTITYINASGETEYFPTTPTDSIIWKDKNTTAILRETYSETTFTASDYNASIKTIDASSITHNIKITGNGKANQILGGYENDTILGGKGNDTLQGGSGADVFVYSNGDGNDRIVDYEENDTIQIKSGTIKSKKTSGNDVIFTIGSGKISLVGAADKTVSYIEGGKKKTYGGSASNVLEDDNFVTGNDLSALVESKAVDYAFAQTTLVQKNNPLPSVTYSSKK